MSAKTNEAKAPLTIEQQIAALTEMKERRDAVVALVSDELAVIRELDKAAIESKNAADQASGQKSNIWDAIKACVFKVYEHTADAPDTRHQVFTDVFDEFLNPKAAAGTDKVKLTTAGQYASTGRKMLVTLLTEQGQSPEDYADATVRDVREAFKSGTVQARNKLLGEVGKSLRYAAKHATEEEWKMFAFVAEAITELYNPVKARKDRSSKKAEAAREVPELQQNAPAEPAVVETINNGDTIADEAAADMAAALNESDAQLGEVIKQQAV